MNSLSLPLTCCKLTLSIAVLNLNAQPLTGYKTLLVDPNVESATPTLT